MKNYLRYLATAVKMFSRTFELYYNFILSVLDNRTFKTKILYFFIDGFPRFLRFLITQEGAGAPSSEDRN